MDFSWNEINVTWKYKNIYHTKNDDKKCIKEYIHSYILLYIILYTSNTSYLIKEEWWFIGTQQMMPLN